MQYNSRFGSVLSRTQHKATILAVMSLNSLHVNVLCGDTSRATFKHVFEITFTAFQPQVALVYLDRSAQQYTERNHDVI